MTATCADAASLFSEACEHVRLGRLAEAEAAFARVLELVPAHAPSLMNLGLVHMAGRKAPAAEAAFKAALAANPDLWEAALNLAALYAQTSRPGEAALVLAGIDSAKAGPPAQSLLETIAGPALAEALNAQPERAAFILRAILSSGQRSAKVMIAVAGFAASLAPDPADRVLAAISDDEDRNHLWLSRAVARLNQGDERESFRSCTKAYPDLGDSHAMAVYPLRDDIGAYARLKDLPLSCHKAPIVNMVDGGRSRFLLDAVRLDDGVVLGTSFVPASREGVAFGLRQVHNPARLKSIAAADRYGAVVCGSADRLIGATTGETRFEGSHLLLGSHENFGHWLLNHFSRLMVAEAVDERDRCKVVIGDRATPGQIECLALAGFPPERICRISERMLARFERLWVPSMPFFSGTDSLLYWAPAVVDYIRRTLAPGVASAKGRRRLLVSRKNARWRRLLNEDEVLAALAGFGIEAIDPGSMGIAQQARLAGEAELILGAFGAGMNLLLFAPADCRIIEMKYRVPGMDINPILSSTIGQDYHQVIGPAVGTQTNPLNRDFTVSAAEVAGLVARLMG